MAKWWGFLIVVCLSVPIKSEDLGVLANLERVDLEPLNADESKKSLQEGSKEVRDPKHFSSDENYSYEEDDGDDWYYDPENVNESSTVLTTEPRAPSLGEEDGEDEDTASETKTQIGAPELQEGVINKEDRHVKKVLQAPKGTIILYTAVIVILIACIVLFSVWRNPFKDGRPVHQPPIIRTGEEGKRLLDHPFV